VKRLQYERVRVRKSQVRVARQARVPQPVISLIERGRLVPTPEQLARLAAVFDIKNPEDLLKDVILFTPVEPPQESAR
jgi:transcriptional regulator with XRE-family HTH domain